MVGDGGNLRATQEQFGGRVGGDFCGTRLVGVSGELSSSSPCAARSSDVFPRPESDSRISPGVDLKEPKRGFDPAPSFTPDIKARSVPDCIRY